jgi:hypothetical protein
MTCSTSTFPINSTTSKISILRVQWASSRGLGGLGVELQGWGKWMSSWQPPLPHRRSGPRPHLVSSSLFVRRPSSSLIHCCLRALSPQLRRIRLPVGWGLPGLSLKSRLAIGSILSPHRIGSPHVCTGVERFGWKEMMVAAVAWRRWAARESTTVPPNPLGCWVRYVEHVIVNHGGRSW